MTMAFEKEHSNGGWLALFRTKGNRWRTWVVVSCGFFSQATGTTLIGYYLSVVLSGVGITNPRTQSIINGCLTMWNMGFGMLPCTTLRTELISQYSLLGCLRH